MSWRQQRPPLQYGPTPQTVDADQGCASLIEAEFLLACGATQDWQQDVEPALGGSDSQMQLRRRRLPRRVVLTEHYPRMAGAEILKETTVKFSAIVVSRFVIED